MAHLKKNWILTRDAFDKLLASLDADRSSAAEKYEDIRRTLVTYFEFRDVAAPEELVDETLDRVARRLDEGQEVYASNPASYFYAVARNVWREYLASPNRAASSLVDMPEGKVRAEDPSVTRERDAERAEREKRLTCLERCLSAMPARRFRDNTGVSRCPKPSERLAPQWKYVPRNKGLMASVGPPVSIWAASRISLAPVSLRQAAARSSTPYRASNWSGSSAPSRTPAWIKTCERG